jgi:hypothetical protein
MRPTDPVRPARSADDDLLDLPALDGELDEPEKGEPVGDEIEIADDGGDAFDDATGEGDPIEAIAVDGDEAGWLVDAEGDGSVDVGTFDISLSDEGKLLVDDEPEGEASADDIDTSEEAVAADSGEEGPLAEDEELREEDLPALDADEDGEVEDEALYDRSLIGEDELRWDDRAWARAPAADAIEEGMDDSGMLAVPGDDPENGPRDATWRRFEESGRLTAAALLPGGGAVVALDHEDRAVIVRIHPDGAARIIAEIEAPGAGGDADDVDETVAHVTALRWDASRGVLIATGPFGVQAFKPA